MTTLHEAAQQALEALEVASQWESEGDPDKPFTTAIAALREALAQQGEQQPVGSVDYGCEPHRINWEINPFSLPDGTPLYAGAAPAEQQGVNHG